MDEVILTEETCIPGTQVIPSNKTKLDNNDYWSNKIVGTVVGLWKNGDKVKGAHVEWDGNPDNYPKKDLKHQLIFEDLTIYSLPPTAEFVLKALDKLEEKYS